MLWEPLALAALNQPPRKAAAPPFARVLGEMFSDDPHAAAIALPTRPLHLMYAEPARDFLERNGSAVRTGAAARLLADRPPQDGFAVDAGGTRFSAGVVVSAVPWFALSEFAGEYPAFPRDVLTTAAAMSSSPIVTVNMWFDRNVLDEPFVGLPGRAMQWVFNKQVVFDGAASHLSLVSSGASPLVAMTNEQLTATALSELVDALPAVRNAALVRSSVVREPRATFSLAPGEPRRPPTKTSVPGLYLAGDWIDTGLPATIESAVRSGHQAADRAIDHLSGKSANK
jgi:zeta-carotene desaturase